MILLDDCEHNWSRLVLGDCGWIDGFLLQLLRMSVIINFRLLILFGPHNGRMLPIVSIVIEGTDVVKLFSSSPFISFTFNKSMFGRIQCFLINYSNHSDDIF